MEEDILYITVRKGPVVDNREVDEDARLEYDGSGEAAEAEIMNARRNMARTLAQENLMRKKSLSTPTSSLVCSWSPIVPLLVQESFDEGFLEPSGEDY